MPFKEEPEKGCATWYCTAEASIDGLCYECDLARHDGRKQMVDEGAPKPVKRGKIVEELA